MTLVLRTTRVLVRRCATCERPALCAVRSDHTAPCRLNESLEVEPESGWARTLRHTREGNRHFSGAESAKMTKIAGFDRARVTFRAGGAR